MSRWRINRKAISSISNIVFIILPIICSFVSFSPGDIASGNGIGGNAFTGNVIGRNAFTGPVVVYPANNTVFSEPFNFRVDVYDVNFANITYQVDSMTSRLFMRNTSTMIDINDWNSLSIGSHYIYFKHTNLGGGMLEAYLPFVKAAQTSELLYSTYGSNFSDTGNGIWSDGMYIYTCGSCDYSGSGLDDLLLVKWDLNGVQIWNSTWDSGSFDVGYDVMGDGTGNIYTCGNTNASSSPSDIVLIKWNSDGDLIWNRTFDNGGIEEARGVWCNESRIYVCGYTYITNSTPLMVFWNPDGYSYLNQTYEELGTGAFNDVWGNPWAVFACGYTGLSSCNLLVAMISEWGSLCWNSTWGGSNAAIGNAIWCDDSWNTYTCGQTWNASTGEYDMLLVKWESENPVWYLTWGGSGNDYGNALWGNGTDIFMCGTTSSFGAGSSDIALLKCNPTGSVVWNMTFGGSSIDEGNDVWGMNSTIFSCGTTRSFGAGLSDMILVKWFGDPFSYNLSITPHADVTYYVNQIGNIIDWILYDSNTSVRNYTIYRDYSWLKNDAWTSGIPVICSVDNLTVGQHSYFIIASDGLGESVQDNVTVLVLPNVSPIISNPADFTFNSDTSSIISWTITDESTGTCVFQIFRDGVWLLNGTWSSSVPINFTIGGLSPGEYSYTIIAYDGLGGSYQNTVVVTVVRGNITESPPYLIITAVICTAAGATFAIVLVTKARSRKRISPAHDETEAARRRERKEASMYKEMPMPKVINQPQVPLAAPVPEHLAPAAPMQWRPTPALCPRCGNALPTEVGKIRFCVYCGEPIHTGNP